MSPKQAVRNPDIKRLLDEGYEVEVLNGYLLVHAVPYVNTQRTVLTGTIVTDLNENVGEHPKTIRCGSLANSLATKLEHRSRRFAIPQNRSRFGKGLSSNTGSPISRKDLAITLTTTRKLKAI